MQKRRCPDEEGPRPQWGRVSLAEEIFATLAEPLPDGARATIAQTPLITRRQTPGRTAPGA